MEDKCREAFEKHFVKNYKESSGSLSRDVALRTANDRDFRAGWDAAIDLGRTTLRHALEAGGKFMRHRDFLGGRWAEYIPEGDFMIELHEDGTVGEIGGVPWGLIDTAGWEWRRS